ncbi:MAG: ParB/RepB/Spo0J family partition protein [Clostridia bacterium]|nr:ParB/RepB/Spo0J family partition protein [Clostridia bacterium]
MAVKKGGLGRGLDALLVDNSIENTSSSSAVKLKLNEIEPNKNQPRKYFDDEALSELAASIEKHGVIQPLLVRPLPGGTYQLVAGERRWRASRMAGLTEVPVVIKELSDADASALALIENLQREDLDPIEEAEGYKYLMETYGVTQEEAAQKVGKSRSAVANLMRLLALPKDVLELVRSKTLSAGHARTLLPLEDAALISQFAKEVIEKGLSVRETEKWVKDFLKPKKPAKPAAEKDKYFTEVELSLCETLARKVSVTGGEKGGSITIEFFDKDDLMKIAKLFEE